MALLAAPLAACDGSSGGDNSASEGSSQSTEEADPSPAEAPRPATVDVGGWTVPSEVGNWVLLTNEDIGRYGAEHGDYTQLFLVDFYLSGLIQPPSQSEVATFDAYGPINAKYTTIGRGDAQSLAFYVSDLDAFQDGRSPIMVSRATGVDESQILPPGCAQSSLVVCTAVVGDVVYGAQASSAYAEETEQLLAALVATQ